MADAFLYYDPVKCRSARQYSERPCDKCRRMKVKCTTRVSANVAQTSLYAQPSIQCERCMKRGDVCSFQDPPLRIKKPRHITTSNRGRKQRTERYPDSPISIPSVPSLVTPNTSQETSWPWWQDDDNTTQIPTISDPPEVLEAPGMEYHTRNSSKTLERILTSSELREGVAEFSEGVFLIFPVIDKDELTSLLFNDNYLQNPESHTLLHAISMLNAIGATQINPTDENRSMMWSLITTVERMRLGYDYAENPSLNTVVIPLLLFAGYSIASKQNRAYLYLQEAISIFELVSASQISPSQQRRHLRLQKILYITEAATIAICGYSSQRPRASTPSDLNCASSVLDAELFSTSADPDIGSIATNIANQLCATYKQISLSALMSEAPTADSTRLSLYLHNNKYVRIITADAVITRQWRLSTELLRLLRNARSPSSPLMSSSVSVFEGQNLPPISLSMVTSVIQHISRCIVTPLSILSAQDLRLVSLAKIPHMADNIHSLSELVGGVRSACQSLLSGLITVIVRGDVDCTFVPSVLELMNKCNNSSAIERLSFRTEREQRQLIEEERGLPEKELAFNDLLGSYAPESPFAELDPCSQNDVFTQSVSLLPMQQWIASHLSCYTSPTSGEVTDLYSGLPYISDFHAFQTLQPITGRDSYYC